MRKINDKKTLIIVGFAFITSLFIYLKNTEYQAVLEKKEQTEQAQKSPEKKSDTLDASEQKENNNKSLYISCNSFF